MNPSGGDGWHGSAGAPPNHPGLDHGGQPPARPLGVFGPNPPPQPGLPQPSGAVLPPPSYHPSSQPPTHALPPLANLTQSAATSHHQPSPYDQHPQSQPPGHSLPSFGQALPHQSPQSALNREREAREHEMRERELLAERQRQEDMAHRERERDREQLERQQREQQHHPVQSHTGSIPLHQPVASKVPNTIHGPNGLLSTVGGSVGMNAQAGGPQQSNGPASMFGGSLQPPEGTPRPYMQQATQPTPSQPLLGLGGPGLPPPPGGNAAALAQGQQPILNDALSYLDQVKVRFSEQPDVYNKFLDIMKDFKSQAIDTPGVIDRVSNLFNGHPTLIQGFNTFLPPGYRIECGTDDNPDTIRVTTPSGTMTQSLQPRHRPSLESSINSMNYNSSIMGSQQPYYEGPRQDWRYGQGAPGAFSPNTHPSGLPSGQPGSQPQNIETSPEFQAQQDRAAANAALVHQQEQRGVSQLQNAVSAATNGVAGKPPMMQMSPEGGPAAMLAQPGGIPVLPGAQGDLNKRGPVEFNHAISYVNKIKNRFAQQPEIYKQFLEILQTYQRESKPIQDVYAQVTQLFNTAPDLLEDFKQFLPESAAQAKAQAAARAAAEEAVVSNIRGDPYGASGPIAQAQTPRPSSKMPPLGQFDPPSSSKEGKKRRAPNQGTLGTGNQPPSGDAVVGGNVQGNRMGSVQLGNANKRPKINHVKLTQPDVPPVSPTLLPQLPEPIPPTNPTNSEEMAFFDRAKKFVGNKQSFNEFLKLCNLFTQDLIDKHILVDRAQGFLGGNPDLMAYFRRFIEGESREETTTEPRIVPDTGRVNLSHCRMLGPSYRLLPKRERSKLCSGRDQICHNVLNDDWASHPTWASEDSGFVAHRKNTFEEGLHRLEEERHDYDFNIEALTRTIQLMEPFVQTIQSLDDASRASFQLPVTLGGHSTTIYSRVIKKIYTRETGQRVLEEMFARPCAVLPIVFGRLKQKSEEWKASQREWEKVWREQTQKFFWKSLDHQGLHGKQNDKKQFQAKTLQNEIQAKFEEQKKSREAGYQTIKFQFAYEFKDTEVVLDACHLLLTHVEHANGANAAEQNRLEGFMKDFIPAFFGLDGAAFSDYMDDIYEKDQMNGDVDSGLTDEATTSKIRSANGRKLDLLRDVLDRRNVRVEKANSVMSGSRGTTPAQIAQADVELPDAEGSPAAEQIPPISPNQRWLEHPDLGNYRNGREVPLNEPYTRDTFNLYANTNVYCFFRVFSILYARLLAIKENEAHVHESVKRVFGDTAKGKAAIHLNMMDKMPNDYFGDVSEDANYYRQIIQMCEEVVKGLLDVAHLEDTLRRFYMRGGWQLYAVDKLMAYVVRFALAIFGSEPKDKSTEIITSFLKDRRLETSTHRQEMHYRRQVEKLVKDGDIYRIAYNPTTSLATIQLFTGADSTFETDDMDDNALWSRYVASYVMLEPTEGVPYSKLIPPMLRRNLATAAEREADFAARHENSLNLDELVIRVCIDTYKLDYEFGTSDVFVHNRLFMEDTARDEVVHEKRDTRFAEKLVMNSGWMKGTSQETVDETKAGFQGWIKDGQAVQGGSIAGAGTDDIMIDA